MQFIVVGGVAAVLNGAPVQTFDVDLVYGREPENIVRLLDVLREIEAIFRLQSERRLRPNESHLAGGGHLNLLTSYGPVDLLATIGNNLGYEELLSHTAEMEIDDGIRIRVLDLETIILLKEQLASVKDLAVLPILRQTLRSRLAGQGNTADSYNPSQ
ncbi:MAG: hypothetical protein M3Z23_10270 [Acidobacteriota bacterium]|nr:hypothetical protein [Acidobacteriota bacterium]